MCRILPRILVPLFMNKGILGKILKVLFGIIVKKYYLNSQIEIR